MPKPKPLAPSAVAYLTRAAEVLAITRQELGPRSSMTRAHLLIVIADREPATFAEVWDATRGAPEPTMEDLESLCAVDSSGRQGRGFVEEIKDPASPHKGRLRLTQAGREAVNRMAAPMADRTPLLRE
jgi:hypothetical protein